VDPGQQYAALLETRRAAVAGLERRHVALGNLRLAIVLIAAIGAWFAWQQGRLLFWLLLPVAVFAALAIYHDAVLRRRRDVQRAVDYYQQGIARLGDNWAGQGEAGDRFLGNAHPYAADLDLFGRGSLFELICRARTRSGEETLAQWLLHPAAAEEILRRREAIEELRHRLDLREDLAVLGETVRRGIHAEPLARWGEQALVLDYPGARAGAVVLAAFTVATIGYWWNTGVRFPVLLAASAQALFAVAFRQRVQHVAASVEEPAHDLALLAAVLARIEREQFDSLRLRELRRRLDVDGMPPSRQVARLNRWLELLDSRDNVAVRIFGPVVLWTTQIAFATEAWRKRSGPAVRGWLEAVGEIEALSSLAAYAFERPGDPFPEIVSGEGVFEARQIAHPLLPKAKAVRNDLRLAADAPLLVVSGSNMSGKSTLLRTVGANAVLAMAGAPVRAEALRLAAFEIGASIRVMDSLQEGSSRFYAEIHRLRLLMELAAKGRPLLFLLDELLHGTNSHDRRIGGEAVVRGLVERGGIGLITTHDLALAHIAEAVRPAGANVHFEDRFENGVITFDYRLREGIVRKSNALDLMRSVGLPV
jgi:hypothetical protein